MNILNTSNDLKNVVLRTSLSPGVEWKNNFIPDDPGIGFNSRTNELKWVIGSLDAGTGFINPVETMAFQLGITPAENQADGRVEILGEVYVEALDTYTGNAVEYNFRESNVSSISDIPSDILEE